MDVAMLVDATFASPAEAANIILLGRGGGERNLGGGIEVVRLRLWFVTLTSSLRVIYLPYNFLLISITLVKIGYTSLYSFSFTASLKNDKLSGSIY